MDTESNYNWVRIRLKSEKNWFTNCGKNDVDWKNISCLKKRLKQKKRMNKNVVIPTTLVSFCFWIAGPPPPLLRAKPPVVLHSSSTSTVHLCTPGIRAILQLKHSGKIFRCFRITLNIRIKPFKHILNAPLLPQPCLVVSFIMVNVSFN